MTKQDDFNSACVRGDIECAMELLTNRPIVTCGDLEANPDLIDELVYPCSAIQIAADNGHMDMVELFINYKNKSLINNLYNRDIQTTAFKGNAVVLKMLLDASTMDISYNNNYILQGSALRGHVNVVKTLINDPRIDPSMHNNKAIRTAMNNGYVAVLNELMSLPRFEDINFDIMHSSVDTWHGDRSGCTDVVKELLKDTRVWYKPLPTQDPDVKDHVQNMFRTLLLILNTQNYRCYRLNDIVRDLHYSIKIKKT